MATSSNAPGIGTTVILKCFSPSKPADKSHTNAAQKNSAGCRDDWSSTAAAAAVAVAAEVSAAAAEVLGGIIVGDEIVCQRHCTSQRKGSPAKNLCSGIQGNARKSKNISCERSVCTQSR